MVDNKPETNATTNCISAIFDINGSNKPNKIGSDVRTLNSLFGYKQLPATAISEAECKSIKDKIGIKYCRSGGSDYFAGAAKACHDLGLHLPSIQTLANAAGARYGRTDIGPYTSILRNDYTNSSYPTSTANCEDYYRAVGPYRLTSGNVICVDGNIPTDSSAGVAISDGHIAGLITDGDIRRAMEKWQAEFFDRTVGDIMTRKPKTVGPKAKISEIQKIMNKNKIHNVLVADADNRLLGIVDRYACVL
jgi:CBS domain-containing protein